jgi:zinc transporter, ZIP family
MNRSQYTMNEFLIVLVISFVAAFLTFLGAPVAERFDVPHKVVSAALQFAAGIITALVGFSLMPTAVLMGPPWGVVLAFFVGGAIFVLFEYYSAKRAAAQPAGETSSMSLGLYFGILVDLVIDGVVIGVGSTVTLATGLLLAIGLAVSTAPLAFVTIATAKRQGMPRENRRILSILFFVCVVAGALLGYVLLRNQSLNLRLLLIALASGFLITTVTQSMIPEANREGEPSFAGVFFVGGLALYALFTLYVK